MFEMMNRENFEEETRPGTFLMVGVSLANVVGAGFGPYLKYVQPEELRSVKLSHPEMVRRLRALKDSGVVEDCWIWNTCNRFEVYAHCKGNIEMARAFIEDEFFASLESPLAGLNVLKDRSALHHLLRTTVGLNSGLPGESDVEQQLIGAVRVSQCVGAIKEWGENLVDRVLKAARRGNARTDWRYFSPSYCQASLESVFDRTGHDLLAQGSIAIIGSSNTSRTCVELLENHFGVDPQNITVYHRCHGRDGQMKQIRRTSNGCRRTKVDDYDAPEIAQAVAESVLTIFGIDRDRPVLSATDLERAAAGRNLNPVIIDFNTFGSTEGIDPSGPACLWNAQDLEKEVRRYALQMTENPRFQTAVTQVEEVLLEESKTFAELFLRSPFERNEERYRRVALYSPGEAVAVASLS